MHWLALCIGRLVPALLALCIGRLVPAMAAFSVPVDVTHVLGGDGQPYLVVTACGLHDAYPQ